jgi:predicted DNA-binding transcriptional regulator YafY
LKKASNGFVGMKLEDVKFKQPVERRAIRTPFQGNAVSLTKARDLLRLAEMAAAGHGGVTLAEIAEEFAADHRTAQRMTRALEETFTGVEVRTGPDSRRRWRLREPGLLRMQGLRDAELAALEMSIRRAEREGAEPDAAAFRSLRDRLLATMPRPHARRAEAGAEALLECQGYASRPGPRVRVPNEILETVAEALKGPFVLAITYAVARDERGRGRRACGEARNKDPVSGVIGFQKGPPW